MAGLQLYKFGFNCFTMYYYYIFSFLVNSNFVTLKTSCAVILSPTVSVLWSRDPIEGLNIRIVRRVSLVVSQWGIRCATDDETTLFQVQLKTTGVLTLLLDTTYIGLQVCFLPFSTSTLINLGCSNLDERNLILEKFTSIFS